MGLEDRTGDDRNEGGDHSTDSTTVSLRIPVRVKEEIDAVYHERGYASASELMRDAIRTWVRHPAPLRPSLVDELRDIDDAEAMSRAEAMERLGRDDGG